MQRPIAKLVLPRSASCTARVNQDPLAESNQDTNPSCQEKVKGGRCSALLKADPRQQKKLNEPFRERGRSAGTSADARLRLAVSRAEKGNLCPSSTLQRLPGNSDSLQSCSCRASWCRQELSAHLSRITGFAGRAPLHVFRVVLETLDDISNRLALIADPIHSSEEGESVGR